MLERDRNLWVCVERLIILTQIKEGGDGEAERHLEGKFFTLRKPISKKNEGRKKERKMGRFARLEW